MIYEPQEDSYLLETYVKKFSANKSILDMGTGSGIQSRAAMQSGASSVLAVDIQDDVIAHLKAQNIPCIKSDLFTNVKGTFDIIAFNPPYLPEDTREDTKSRTATTGGKQGDEIMLRFLVDAPKHLNSEGTILLILSSLTPRSAILELLKNQKLTHRVLETKKLFMETLECWEIRKKQQ